MARPTLITVQGTYLTPAGTPESGRVTFAAPVFARHNASDDVVAPGLISAVLDANGDVTLQVPATDDPAWSPVDWTYRVSVQLSSTRVDFDAAIPYDTPGAVLDLSDLLPAQPSSGVLYAPVSHTHDDRYPTDAEVTSAITAALTPYITTATAQTAFVDPAELAAALASYLTTATATSTYLPKADGVVSDSTLTVKKADDSSGIRMRSTGGAVDFDKMNGDIVVSSFAGPGFGGAQTGLQRWRNTGSTFAGLTEFGDTVYGGQQNIDGASGVAALGAKNSLTNLRFCGYKGTAGAPAAGAWATGDLVMDSAKVWWRCTAGGTPGTWA